MDRRQEELNTEEHESLSGSLLTIFIIVIANFFGNCYTCQKINSISNELSKVTIECKK